MPTYSANEIRTFSIQALLPADRQMMWKSKRNLFSIVVETAAAARMMIVFFLSIKMIHLNLMKAFIAQNCMLLVGKLKMIITISASSYTVTLSFSDNENSKVVQKQSCQKIKYTFWYVIDHYLAGPSSDLSITCLSLLLSGLATTILRTTVVKLRP